MIEGRIGTSKRKYGLDRIMTRLVATSKTVIGMAFFVMNAEKILRLLRLLFARCLCFLHGDYVLVRSLVPSSAFEGD